MEAKQPMGIKGSTASDAASRQGSPKVGEFIGEVKAELKRIDWTSQEELKVYTRIVVIATFALGLGIYFVDLFIQTFLMGLGNIVRWLIG